jgi:hypothetical protein
VAGIRSQCNRADLVQGEAAAGRGGDRRGPVNDQCGAVALDWVSTSRIARVSRNGWELIGYLSKGTFESRAQP